MTLSGRQIFLRNSTVHVERHCGSTPLREGCEVVIFIEMGLSFRPRKMVPLDSNFDKGLPPLAMCPLRPYNNESEFLLPNFPDTMGKSMIGRAHPIRVTEARSFLEVARHVRGRTETK